MFSWFKVIVRSLLQHNQEFHSKREEIVVYVIYLCETWRIFPAEIRLWFSSSRCRVSLYLYFLYGSSSKFWTVKLRRKIKFPTNKQKHELFTTFERQILHILQSMVHRVPVTICSNCTLSPCK